MGGLLRPLHVLEPWQLNAEHFAIHEQDCVEGLILCRGGHLAANRQIAQERGQRLSPKLAGRPLAVK